MEGQGLTDSIETNIEGLSGNKVRKWNRAAINNMAKQRQICCNCKLFLLDENCSLRQKMKYRKKFILRSIIAVDFKRVNIAPFFKVGNLTKTESG